jgi:hypothetical protein
MIEVVILELIYLELLFLTVFAFPKASRTGFDCRNKDKKYMFS